MPMGSSDARAGMATLGPAGDMSPAPVTGPVRMCVICRRRFPKGELTRYTRGAAGELIFDAKKTDPGRGWYVCADERCRQKIVGYRPSGRRKG